MECYFQCHSEAPMLQFFSFYPIHLECQLLYRAKPMDEGQRPQRTAHCKLRDEILQDQGLQKAKLYPSIPACSEGGANHQAPEDPKMDHKADALRPLIRGNPAAKVAVRSGTDRGFP